MEKHPHNSKWCPFWNAKGRRCDVSRNGLFIPTTDYINTFCTSTKHASCHLYKEEIKARKPEKSEYTANRRKHTRIPSDRVLTLLQITNPNGSSISSDETAYTRNLSAGGMLIQTQTPLFHGSLVSYTYPEATDPTEKKGTAQVAWCRYNKESLVYLAGLRFQDRHTTRSAGIDKKPS